MDKKESFYVGYIASKHGINSSVLIKMDVDNSANYVNVDGFFIDINKNLVPVFVKSARVGKKNELIVELEDIKDVKTLIGSSVYLPLEQLPTLEDNKFYFHEVIGFKVIDKNKGEIGEIESILDFPHQQIFSIKFGRKEILIPIVDEFILRVDKTKKTIELCAPEGLIDIYLSDSKTEEE